MLLRLTHSQLVLIGAESFCDDREVAMVKKRPQLALARGSKIRNSLMDGYEASLECDV